jgi:hypothetical protein
MLSWQQSQAHAHVKEKPDAMAIDELNQSNIQERIMLPGPRLSQRFAACTCCQHEFANASCNHLAALVHSVNLPMVLCIVIVAGTTSMCKQ